MNLLKIRNLKEGERFRIAGAGSYENEKGETILLSNPQAATLRAMQKFNTTEEQFQFFCLAYLYELTKEEQNLRKEVENLDEYRKWIEKFGFPWPSNSKNVLPLTDTYFDYFIHKNKKIAKGRKINMDLLRKEFQKYNDCSFILY